MATVTVGTTATTLDTGSSGLLQIVNTGALQALVARGTDRPQVVWPGGKLTISPRGTAVTATTPSSTTTLDVTTDGADGAGLPGTGTVAFEDLGSDVVPGLGLTFARGAGGYPGGGLATLGDSISANYGASGANSVAVPASQAANNHAHLALMQAKQSPRYVGTFATGGYTLEQMRDTLLPRLLASTPKPAAVFCLGGTNNVGQNGGVGFSASAAISVVAQISATLMTNGIRPIWGTIPPRGDNSTVNQAVRQYNRALRSWCSQNGFDLIDFHKVLVDPVTGNYRTGYGQTDGVHPSYKGVIQMSRLVTPVLTSRFPASPPPLGADAVDAQNLMRTSGLFTADTNADGVADGWGTVLGGATGYTFSIQTDADGVTKWQRISMPNTATGAPTLQWVSGAICSPGDVMEFCCRVQSSGYYSDITNPVSGGSGGGGNTFYVSVTFNGDPNNGMYPAYGVQEDITDGVLYARWVVGTGATGVVKVNLQTGAPAAGTSYFQVANCALRNLTALGIASYT